MTDPDPYAVEVYADEVDRLATALRETFDREGHEIPANIRNAMWAATLGSVASMVDGQDMRAKVRLPDIKPGSVMARLCSVVDGWRE